MKAAAGQVVLNSRRLAAAVKWERGKWHGDVGRGKWEVGKWESGKWALTRTRDAMGARIALALGVCLRANAPMCAPERSLRAACVLPARCRHAVGGPSAPVAAGMLHAACWSSLISTCSVAARLHGLAPSTAG